MESCSQTFYLHKVHMFKIFLDLSTSYNNGVLLLDLLFTQSSYVLDLSRLINVDTQTQCIYTLAHFGKLYQLYQLFLDCSTQILKLNVSTPSPAPASCTSCARSFQIVHCRYSNAMYLHHRPHLQTVPAVSDVTKFASCCAANLKLLQVMSSRLFECSMLCSIVAML